MARKGLIARAGNGLFDFFALLIRGVRMLFSAFGRFFIFAWSNEERRSEYVEELTSSEKRMRELDPDFEEGGFYRYRRD